MATVASLERNVQLRIRDLICENPIALYKWARIVDAVVSSPGDVFLIKDWLKKHDYAEATLRTLQLCNCELVGVLRLHELNSVADKIATVLSGCNYSLTHIWHDVGELPHNVSGRDSELADAHMRLSHHSNRSVDANIVCISGPAGCGKSTLARQYAFDNCEFYGWNVVWIDAKSTESIKASFTKLATTKTKTTKDNQTLAEDVYDFFKERKCLFVFDGLKNMEDFNQFRPKIISPLYSTPYLLVTSREGGLAPVRENELSILHYRVAVLKSIEEMSKPTAELAKQISYLDPGVVTVRFLEEVFDQVKKSGLDFHSCLHLLEKHKLVEGGSKVTMKSGVQEIIRSSLSEEEEASSLHKIRETHKHLVEKRTTDLVEEGTAHRLHLLHSDLKSISLADYLEGLSLDLLDYSDNSSMLKISLQAYEILRNRFGEEDGATIQVRYWIAHAHYLLNDYPEAIGMLESILPVAKTALGDRHGATGRILRLLSKASDERDRHMNLPRPGGNPTPLQQSSNGEEALN